MSNLDSPDLSIGEVARRTGIAVPTLRMWESRYGFPTPQRRASGHRRYTNRDCVLLSEVKRAREGGHSMATVIDHVRRRADEAETSIYRGVRHRHPELESVMLPEPFMLAISRAIEQESRLSARGAVLVGCFQRQAAWSSAKARWRELARIGCATVAFADFRDARLVHRVWELPLEPGSALAQEWALICDGPEWSACLVGRERLPSARRAPRRVFDAVWSVEPEVVRDATRIAIALATRHAPSLRHVVALQEPPAAPPDGLRRATVLTNRIVANVLDIARGPRDERAPRAV